MRVLLMFDLPTSSKKDIKIYSNFRKHLIEKGFSMIQYSVYVKIVCNRDATTNVVDYIKRIAPDRGRIRVIVLTEKQYQSMLVIIGGLSKNEEKISKEVMLII